MNQGSPVMRWLIISGLFMLPLLDAEAKIFCYYLVDKEGNVTSYREPPWDLSYPPDQLSAEERRKREVMGHLIVNLIDGACQQTGKSYEEMLAERRAKAAKMEKKAEAVAKPTESVEVSIDTPPPSPKPDREEEEAGEEESSTQQAELKPGPAPDAPPKVETFSGHEAAVTDVSVQGNLVISVSDEGTGRVWEIDHTRKIREFTGPRVTALAMEEGRILLGFDSPEENLIALDAKSGSEVIKYQGHTAKVTDIAVDKGYMLSGGVDEQLLFWQTESGRPVETIRTPEDVSAKGIGAVALDLENMRGFAGHGDAIYVWDLKAGKALGNWTGQGEIISLASDGSKVAVAYRDANEIEIWSIDTQKLLNTLSGHSGHVYDLVAREGKLVSASADQTIKIWDLDNGNLLRTLEGHEGAVRGVAVDGSTIVSGSDDKTVRVWINHLGEKALSEGDDATSAQGSGDTAAAGDFKVPLPLPATTLALGRAHTCAVRAGQVECVGSNSNAQLGNGNNTEASGQAVTVAGLSGIQAIASHADSNCALGAGDVYCWGWDAIALSTRKDKTPERIAGLDGVTAIAVGAKHQCVISGGGQVWCWGENMEGQLGDGTTSSQLKPVPAKDLSGAAAIAAGAYHTCALLDSGEVRCWGKNYSGQVGNGTRGKDKVPAPVAVKDLKDAVALSAGADHTCALHANGLVSCWGKNEFGQLGNGESGAAKYSAIPARVKDLSRAVYLGAGHQHACAVLADGGARCWGSNRHGQLGNGSMSSKDSPVTPVAVKDLNDARLIGAGQGHTCALRKTDSVVCWGQNSDNQLGFDAGVMQMTPIELEFGGSAAPEEGEETASEKKEEDDSWEE